MLYSEQKERQKRFIFSLRIAIPLILVIGFFGYFFIIKNDYNEDDIILFVILILCYVYYVVYLLYFAFKKSLIDPVTKTFNTNETVKILSKIIQKKKEYNIILIRLNNINDINERYGYKNSNQILKKTIIIFNNFMKNEGFKKLIIGRYIDANFISIIDCKTSKLEHILNNFVIKMSKEGIDNIEVKIDFATVISSFSLNLHYIINELFFKINHKIDNKDKILKPDLADLLICDAIDKMKFKFMIQTIKSLNNNSNLYKIYIKFDLKELKTISKNKIFDIIAKSRYETKYDIQILKFIASNIDFIKFDSKVLIEILPISIRNNQFKNELIRLMEDKKLVPEKIIFEFHENKIYSEIQRFKEILTEFKNIGFSFALNNFLGKNIWFTYFKSLPLDYIIYDIDFSKDYKNEKIFTIFTNFNRICKELGIKSIVRFVDKENFYDKLKDSEVDYLQGFYIDKPKEIKI